MAKFGLEGDGRDVAYRLNGKKRNQWELRTVWRGESKKQKVGIS